MVLRSSSWMYSSASRNSFQAASAEKIATVARPGRSSGSASRAEDPTVAGAVDARRLEQLLGQRVEVHLEQVDRERQPHRRVRDDQRAARVGDRELREQLRLGDEVRLERQQQPEREQAHGTGRRPRNR